MTTSFLLTDAPHPLSFPLSLWPLKGGALNDADVIAKRLERKLGWDSESIAHEGGANTDAKAFVVRLRALIEQGRWKEAMSSVTAAAGVEVPWMAYSVLVQAAGRQGQWQEAVELLLRMYKESDDGDPSKGSLTYLDFSAAINACRVAGEWEVCLQLLNIMRTTDQQKGGGDRKRSTSDVKPNQITYGLVLKALHR